MSFYTNIESKDSTDRITDPSFVYTASDEENITHIWMNSSILVASWRRTNKYYFSTYELKIFYVEDKSLRYLYTIPIWAEDINDNAINPLYITDLIFEDDIVQYTYSHTITVQRKAEVQKIKNLAEYSESNIVMINLNFHRLI